MNAEQTKIAAAFLREHFNIACVKFYGTLTVYFADGDPDPWGVQEFLNGSPTRLMLEKLEVELREAEE